YESRNGSIFRRYHAICEALGLTEPERNLLRAKLTILSVRELRKSGKQFPSIPPTPLDKKSKQLATQQKALEFWGRLVADYPADIYCLDPMRCTHEEAENDSKMAGVMMSLQVLFKGKTVIVPHHLYKLHEKDENDAALLERDMRQWSDRGRGSGAIKAHADLIICQARAGEIEAPRLHVGAFGRDIIDIPPLELEQTAPESFTWQAFPKMKAPLERAWVAFRDYETTHGDLPTEKGELVKILERAGINTKTAYKHIDALIEDRLLQQDAAGTLSTRTRDSQQRF